MLHHKCSLASTGLAPRALNGCCARLRAPSWLPSNRRVWKPRRWGGGEGSGVVFASVKLTSPRSLKCCARISRAPSRSRSGRKNKTKKQPVATTSTLYDIKYLWITSYEDLIKDLVVPLGRFTCSVLAHTGDTNNPWQSPWQPVCSSTIQRAPFCLQGPRGEIRVWGGGRRGWVARRTYTNATLSKAVRYDSL